MVRLEKQLLPTEMEQAIWVQTLYKVAYVSLTSNILRKVVQKVLSLNQGRKV